MFWLEDKLKGDTNVDFKNVFQAMSSTYAYPTFTVHNQLGSVEEREKDHSGIHIHIHSSFSLFSDQLYKNLKKIVFSSFKRSL